MKSVTLGGKNRIGSGSKMKVNLREFDRTSFNVNRRLQTTASVGTCIPVLQEIALPGTTHDIKCRLDMMTGPTVGPLFGSMKAQVDVFSIPIRLYQAQLHNNKNGVGLNMDKIKFPLVQLIAPNPSFKDEYDIDNYQVNPSHLLNYLDIKGAGVCWNPDVKTVTKNFNGIPYLGYFDIYKNFYANKQEAKGAMIHAELVNDDLEIAYVNLEGITTTTPGQTTYMIPESDPPGGTEKLTWWTEDTFVTVALNGFESEFDPGLIKLAITVANPAVGEYPLTELFDNFAWQDVGGGDGILTAYNPKEKWIKKNGMFSYRFDKKFDIPLQPNVVTFPLKDIDDMREDILSKIKTTTPYMISYDDPSSAIPQTSCYKMPLKFNQTDFGNALSDITSTCTRQSQEGLCIKTFQSDIFNNWLDSEQIGIVDKVSAIKVETLLGQQVVYVNEINLKQKVWDMFNAIQTSGGSYIDYVDAVYDHEMYMGIYSPVYCGGTSKELVFQQIISNASTEGEPLGTLAGRGVLKGEEYSNITIKTDEPSFIMAIFSLTPRIAYSQGNGWLTDLKKMNDLHSPYLDQIAFQDLITTKMAWWDLQVGGGDQGQEGIQYTKSAGKQPAWIDYQTSFDQVKGNFAIESNQMYMTLTRRYKPSNWTETDPGISGITIEDLTTYIDPASFNYIFADTSLDAQNYWVQIDWDITARRKMSGKIMPQV